RWSFHGTRRAPRYGRGASARSRDRLARPQTTTSAAQSTARAAPRIRLSDDGVTCESESNEADSAAGGTDLRSTPPDRRDCSARFDRNPPERSRLKILQFDDHPVSSALFIDSI